jgi:hypothetical protein
MVSVMLPCGVFPAEWSTCELSVAVDLSDNLCEFTEDHMHNP